MDNGSDLVYTTLLPPQGYVTMYAEDTAWMGLFHYLSRGFVNQPTDYDARPLMYTGEKNLARGGGSNAQYCIGQRHQIEVGLRAWSQVRSRPWSQ